MLTFKYFYLLPLKAYQSFSKLSPPSCRYYPTCSEYAKWQFEYNQLHRAIFATTKRILRCNPLFVGGIDYPLVYFRPSNSFTLYTPKPFLGKINIIYWLIPKKSENTNTDYYVIKDFDAINRAT